MAMSSTPNQGAPYPLASEKLADGNDHVRLLAQWADGRVVMRFADQAELATKVPAPVSGQVAWIIADKVLQVHDGTSWKRIYPYAPMTYSGATVPASSLGAVGDFYVQY